LNETLLAKAVAAKVLRTSKIRVDTTVIPADVARAINRIATTGRRIRASGGAARTRLRDRSRAAGRRAHDLNAKLRTRNAAARDEALAVVKRN
jgi:IS5 family transposase